MKKAKTAKIIYCTSTGIIVLMEGLIPALTSQTELAKQGIAHLGYPSYFGNTLVVFKVLGALALLIPRVSRKIKEIAYVGFAFDFLFASISHFAVDGMDFQSIMPLLFLGILFVSYKYYNKLNGGMEGYAVS